MALVDFAWYTSSVAFSAVTAWSNHTEVAGHIIRATAPAVGSERCYICITGGAAGSSQPTWVTTRGALNTSSSAVYQECTGAPALNGDLTNTATWAQVKAAAPAVLGQIIKTSSGGDSLQICNTAGTMGAAEPTFSTTAGTQTGETSAVATWKSLGAPGNFGVLACPHGRVENALASTWGATGNTFFVADNHTQTVATTLSLVIPSTNALPGKLISFANGVGSAPPTSATSGAIVSVSGNAVIGTSGWGEVNGLTINGGTTTGTSAQITLAGSASNAMLFKNCAMVLRNGSATFLNIGASGNQCSVIFDNTTVTFGSSASQYINQLGKFYWKNTPSGAVAWTTQPTALFNVNAANRPCETVIEGVDFSNVTNSIVSGAIAGPGSFVLKDCKLNASTSLMTATPTATPYVGIDSIRSDSGDTNDNMARKTYSGDLTIERTIIRAGGAPIAWKIVTTSNSSWIFPFECPPIYIWNDVTSGTITATVYGAVTGAPNKEDIWIDLEGLGTASYSLGTFVTSGRASSIGASAACDVDGSSSWGGSPPANLFSMSVTYSPVKAGQLAIYIKAAKAGTTYYVDPRPVVSGNKLVSQSYPSGTGSYSNELFAGISRNRIGIGM